MTARSVLASLAVVASISVWASGCGGASGDSPGPLTPTPTRPPSVERDVPPARTDPDIDTFLSVHVAINPSATVAARGQLFVFLPGTYATPALYRLILRAAAARGFHAVGLTYPNASTIQDLCMLQTGADCWGNARREILTGEDTSAALKVNRANSIENRLVKLLSALAAGNPDEGWDRFLSDGGPAWSLITVAGHSQGGGHAAFIAKRESLARAVYFSSPYDFDSNREQPAAWVRLPNITPADRQYGFAHRRDELVSWSMVQWQWSTLGLAAFGPPTSVDTGSPPWAGSHQFYTDLAPVGAAGLIWHHNMTVLDAATPLAADGRPVLVDVWNTLCFP